MHHGDREADTRHLQLNMTAANRSQHCGATRTRPKVETDAERGRERERERERVKIQFEESQMSRSSVGAHFQIWFAALRHCLGADLNKMKWNSWNEKKKKQNGENGSSSKTVARWKCTSRWPEGPAEKNKKIVSSAGEILVGASIQMAADLLLSGRDDPAAFNSFFWLVPLVGWSLPKSESA